MARTVSLQKYGISILIFVILFPTAQIRDRVLADRQIEGRNFRLAFSLWCKEYRCEEIEWNTKVKIMMSRIPPQSCNAYCLKPLVALYCDIRTISINEPKGTCTITGFEESVESIPHHANLGMSCRHDQGTNIKGFKIKIITTPCDDSED